MSAVALVVAVLAFLGLLAALAVAAMTAAAADDVREATPALLVSAVLAALLCGLAIALRGP